MTTVRKWNKTLIVGALGIAMFTGSLAPASAFLDKTRFLAHLGVAYFAFHHWVLNPYNEGKFNDGADHRTATIVKGGAALLFAYHEVKVSEKISRESHDPLLQKLNGAVGGLAGSFGTIGQKLKSGHFDPKDIAGLSSITSVLSSTAAKGGAQIKDVPVALPGT